MKKNNKLISRLIITPIGLACNREGVCVCVRIIMFDIAVFYPPAIKANIFFPNTDISSPRSPHCLLLSPRLFAIIFLLHLRGLKRL